MAAARNPAEPARPSWLRGNVIAAAGAQLSQAFASFLLQLMAARSLGAAGLGAFSLFYGFMVLGTAISTGLVGDSLTVLDRRDARVRAGLLGWTVVLAVGIGVVVGVVGWAQGYLSPWAAVAAVAACAAFMAEDVLRRTLMAVGRFWALVAVDLCSLIVSTCWVVAVGATGDVRLGTFVTALLLGQVVAGAVAVLALPRAEIRVRPERPVRWREVWDYGMWRALQQGLRPAMMATVRVFVTAAVGLAAFGALDAARVYVAPAMLVVSGVGSYLFASYARDRHRVARESVRRADRAVLVLVVCTLVGGGLALALLRVGGPLLTGGSFDIAPVAVVGWVAYAAATGVVTPYGSLAAVRGAHVRVFMIRAIESIAGVAVTAAVLVLTDRPNLVPAALAVVAVASGLVLRRAAHATHAADTQAADTGTGAQTAAAADARSSRNNRVKSDKRG